MRHLKRRRTSPEPPPRILVVEDVFLTAESLAAMLRELDYDVAGPVPTNAHAVEVVATERVDGALLDVNLRGEPVTPVADLLTDLGKPFLFLTADPDLDGMPTAHRERPWLRKPCVPESLKPALEALLDRSRDV